MGSLETHRPSPEGPRPPAGRVRIDDAGTAARLHSLADAARAIAGATSLDDLLRAVTESARSIVGTHQAVTTRVRDTWEGARSHVSLSDKYAAHRDYDVLPRGLGLVKAVTGENRPLRLTGDEVLAHPEWRGLRDAPPGHPPLPDYLAAPLVSRDGQNIGLVQLSDKVDGTAFTEDDEAVLVQLAHMVSAAVEHVEVAARYEQAVSHLGLALDAGHLGIWEWDYDTDEVRWSPALEQLLGYSPGGFPGTFDAFLDHIHPDDVGEMLGRIEKAQVASSRYDYAYRVRTVDGETRWLEGSGLPVRDLDGEIAGMTGVCLDATERRAVEHDLRREHRITESLQEVGKAVTARLDLSEVLQIVTDTATRLCGAAFGSFFYNVVSDSGESYALYTLSGAPKEAFSRFPMPRATDVFGPTFRGESVVRLDDVTADPRYGRNPPYRGMPEGHLPVRSYLAVPVVLADGEVAGGLFFGHPDRGVFDDEAERFVVGVVGYAAIAIENARLYEAARRELAARQEALEERAAVAARLERTVADLHAAENRYGDLVNSLEAVVWTATLPELAFTFVSDRAEPLLGYPAARFVEETGFWQSIIHPDDREWALTFSANETALGRDHDFEYRAVAADGRIVWLLDVVTVVRDDGGEVTGLQGLMIDVTRRKRAEQRESAQLAVTRVLAESGLSGDAFDEILQGVGRALDMDVAALWIADGDSLSCTHLWTNGRGRTGEFAEVSRRLRLGPGEGLAGRVWQMSRPQWVEDLASASWFVRAQQAAAAELVTGFAVPILVGGQSFGVIDCFSSERRPRDDELLETMSTVVTQLGQSFGRLQAEATLDETMQSLRRRSAQLRRLAEVASAINVLGSVADVLRLVTHEARLLLGAHQAAATVARPGQREAVVQSTSLSEKYAAWRGRGCALGDTLAELVRERGRAVRLSAQAVERLSAGDDFCGPGTDSPPVRGLLAVPLDTPDGSTVGMLWLSDRYTGEFGEDDEAVLVQLGEIASAAVHKTRLYAERSQVADALQRPLQLTPLPSIPSVEVAACYEPYGEMLSVGGDFYDVFRIPSGRWVTILGDVCGKGPEAAALTGLARQTLWAGAQHSDDPAEILALLNEAILRTGSDRFCTAAAVVMETGTDGVHLRFASAGHPPPLVLSADGTVRPVDGEGMLLGMFPEIGVRSTRLTLRPGEAFVLYSDGLTEGGGAATFDGTDLHHAVSGMAGWHAPEIVEGLLAGVRQRRVHQRDDLALLVLRASGASGASGASDASATSVSATSATR
ncbi:MAG: GAF domain-containing protein [Actinomycetes bacterium]